jgi:hypothetical protein
MMFSLLPSSPTRRRYFSRRTRDMGFGPEKLETFIDADCSFLMLLRYFWVGWVSAKSLKRFFFAHFKVLARWFQIP